jgi:hypothetical protein
MGIGSAHPFHNTAERKWAHPEMAEHVETLSAVVHPVRGDMSEHAAPCERVGLKHQAGCPVVVCKQDIEGVAGRHAGGTNRSTSASRAHDIDAPSLAIEKDHPIGKSKQRIIASTADIPARMVARAALPYDDPARPNALAAVNLDAQALAVRFTSVADRALTFLVSHYYLVCEIKE